MAGQGDEKSRGMGTMGGLAALFVLAVAVQMSFPIPGSGASGTAASGSAGETLQKEIVGAHRVVLDDLLAAGYSPDGVAARAGTFRDVVSGSDHDRVDFVADVDSDGASERLRFEVRDGALVRTRFVREGESWKPLAGDVLAEGVERFSVAFLDHARSILSAEEVTRGRGARAVQVSLRLSRETGIGRAAETLSGEVALRNLAG